MAGTLFSKAMIEFGLNTQNALQQLTSFQQRFANGIGQMKSLLVGFVGFQGLRGAYNTLTDLVDVANKWDLPVEKVSQFTNLFTQFGGSAEEAVASLDKFQEMANQLRFHSSGPLKELSAILRTNLSNKDYMGVIQAIRSQWGQLNASARAEVQRMLGVSSDAMRRMLASSDQEFAAALKNSEKFGKLTVVSLFNVSPRKYLCQCECGGQAIVQPGNLKDGHTQSCGCISSLGQEKINAYLSANKIHFKPEYSVPIIGFDGLARYDFAILNSHNKAKILIEYHGKQHYEVAYSWNDSEEDLKDRQRKDELKRQWAKEHNIPLYEIPYWEFENIEIILNEMFSKVGDN